MAKTNYKQRFSDYKKRISAAYKAGYTAGWNESISKDFGAKTSALIGYSKGISARRKDSKVKKLNSAYLLKSYT